METPAPAHTSGNPGKEYRKKAYPYILDLNLPSLDWELSSLQTIGESPKASSEYSSIFSPFDSNTQDQITDPSFYTFQRFNPGLGRNFSLRSRNAISRLSSIHYGNSEMLYSPPMASVAPSSSTAVPPWTSDTVSLKRLTEHDSEEAESDHEKYPTGIRFVLIVIALVLSIFLIALDMTIVATAIPAITDEFKGLKDVAWYGSVFFMTVGGFQSTWGKIYKYFPLKISFLIAIAVFELGSLMCAVAPSSLAFIIGRAIAGVGAGGISSGSYTIMGFITEPKKRPAYAGVLGAVYGISSVLGPLLGGAFAGTTTWRWCFYINLPVGGLSLVTIFFFFSTPKAARPQKATRREKFLQMDPVGACLLMGAIIAYLLAVQYGGQEKAWSSSTVIGLLVGTILIAATFAMHEYLQSERALIIPRLFRRRVVFLGSIYTVFASGSFFAMVYYLPIYFQAVQGTNAVESGVRNLPFILAATLGAFGTGIFISATGLSTLVMVASGAIGSLGCGLCYLFDADTPMRNWIGYQIIAGLGMGSSLQIPVIVTQVSVDAVDLSSATSILLCFQVIGGALVVSAAQSAFANRLLLILPTSAPLVPPEAVLVVGAGQLRHVFSAQILPGIVVAYMNGLKVSYALSCAGAGMAFLVGLCFSWKRLDTNAVKEAAGAA